MDTILKQGGCTATCLIVVLFFVLFPILPIVLPIFLLVKLWQSSWTMRTKRAITGAVFYPLGAYFIWRYTRYSQQLKLGVVAAAIIGTWMITSIPFIGISVLPILMIGFLVLFLMAEPTEPEPVVAPRTVAAPSSAPPRPTPRRSLSAADIPPSDLRMLLEIEKARSAEERRLLLAREFGRLAVVAISFRPEDRKIAPTPREIALLRDEVSLLKASALDPSVHDLPDANPTAPMTFDELTEAIVELDRYARTLASNSPGGEPSLEQVRVLVRDRSRLQEYYDEIVERLGDLPKTPM